MYLEGKIPDSQTLRHDPFTDPFAFIVYITSLPALARETVSLVTRPAVAWSVVSAVSFIR